MLNEIDETLFNELANEHGLKGNELESFKNNLKETLTEIASIIIEAWQTIKEVASKVVNAMIENKRHDNTIKHYNKLVIPKIPQIYLPNIGIPNIRSHI